MNAAVRVLREELIWNASLLERAAHELRRPGSPVDLVRQQIEAALMDRAHILGAIAVLESMAAPWPVAA